MPFIGNQPALSYTSFAKQDFTTSATTTYTLDNPVSNANELALFINFVRQEPTTAYTASGTTLTLTSATASSDDMYCVYLGKAVQTVNPPNASVGLSQLTATGTKDATTFLRGDNSFQVVSSDWVKIAHTNVTSAVSSVDFVNGTGGVVIDSTYRYYKLFCTWRPSTNGAVFYVRVANGGTFRTSGYLAEVFRSYYSGGTGRANGTAMLLRGVGGTQNATEQRSNAELTFYNMSDSTLNTTAQLLSQAIDGTGNTENQVNNQIGGGVYTIFMDSGNIEAGEFTLYGIKE
jgi:hypothetical protein